MLAHLNLTEGDIDPSDADDGGDNPILQDPGSLRIFESGLGGVHRFKVTGSAKGGSVWGTNAYTSDSALAVAAVHSGVLLDGQTGVVRALIVPPQANYAGSTANGITSSDATLSPGKPTCTATWRRRRCMPVYSRRDNKAWSK